MSEGSTLKPSNAAKEAQFFFSIISNMKDSKLPANVDWEKVALECEYKSGSTAKVRWGQIRRAREKKNAEGSDQNDSTKAATKTQAAAKPSKAKTPKADTKGKVTKTAKTPAGKGKASGKAAKAEKVEPKDEDLEDDFADAPEEAGEDIASEDDQTKDEKK